MTHSQLSVKYSKRVLFVGYYFLYLLVLGIPLVLKFAQVDYNYHKSIKNDEF